MALVRRVTPRFCMAEVRRAQILCSTFKSHANQLGERPWQCPRGCTLKCVHRQRYHQWAGMHATTLLLFTFKNFPGEKQPAKRHLCPHGLFSASVHRHLHPPMRSLLTAVTHMCLVVLIQFIPTHKYPYTYADMNKQ